MAVTQELWAAVFRRDGGCVAVQADKVGLFAVSTPCTDTFGRVVPWDSPTGKTVEHVREFAAMGGPRAPDDLMHLVCICAGHGVQAWELSHKDVERAYLAKLYPREWAEFLARQEAVGADR
jgi:hypothetical protein